jgi:hypothetical protein
MRTSLIFKFLDSIPEELGEGILYITVKYKSATHLCACGCGNEVITPITPNFWEITFDGKSVSLSPSIGSRNLDCKSHYWIKRNQIVIASSWSYETNDFESDKKIKKKKGFFKKKKKD